MKAWLAGLSSSRRDWLAGALLVLAIGLAYSGSLHGPLVLDDVAAIRHNPTIRSLWPPWGPLFPPFGGTTVGGRPVLNYSLALNYAVGGTGVVGYHLVNLAVHLAAALLLFGIVRRTLLQPLLASTWGDRSRSIAFAAALLWGLHPLQTEAVTYLIQRAESLAGLFFLLALYGFIRATEPGGSVRWRGLSLAACLLGMGTKETMAAAPLVIALYDRTFVAGSFREVWRCRGRFHLLLASTWIWLAWLVAGNGNRGGTAGWRVDVPGLDVDTPSYLLTQCRSIITYLQLTFWPSPLVFDRGLPFLHRFAEAWPCLLALAPLLLGIAFALRWRPLFGFVGAWFFLVLAPSSSVIPISDAIWEHRMYLALAAPAVLAALLLDRWFGKRSWACLLCLALLLGTLTWKRNRVYRSELALWSDTVSRSPDNARARFSLAHALTEAGRADEGGDELAMAQRLQETAGAAAAMRHPDDPRFQLALAQLLIGEGKEAEGRAGIEAALRLSPRDPAALDAEGMALLRSGQNDQALQTLTAATQQPLAGPRPFDDLGIVLIQEGRLPEAGAAFTAALRIDPRDASANANLGNVLLQQGDLEAAGAHFRVAIRSDPALARAHFGLALALAYGHRYAEAAAECSETLDLDPDHAGARALLWRLEP